MEDEEYYAIFDYVRDYIMHNGISKKNLWSCGHHRHGYPSSETLAYHNSGHYAPIAIIRDNGNNIIRKGPIPIRPFFDNGSMICINAHERDQPDFEPLSLIDNSQLISLVKEIKIGLSMSNQTYI